MDERLELFGEVFVWDREKAIENERNHAVSFAESATSFSDPQALLFDDEEHSVDEVRSTLIGFSYEARLLRVTHTERNHEIRLISARMADSYDAKRYATGY